MYSIKCKIRFIIIKSEEEARMKTKSSEVYAI